MSKVAPFRDWYASAAGAPWFGYVAATLAVALMNWLIGLAQTVAPRIANLSTFNLISVLAVAIAFGRGPAIWASVLSFLVFNWFFVQPLHTFAIADPNEWIVLFAFLITAITTGHLAAGQRKRAEEAEGREQETALLYDVGRLMSEPRLDSALAAVAGRLLRELDLQALVIEIPDEAGKQARISAGDVTLLADSPLRGGAAYQMLVSGAAPSGAQRGEPGRWVRIVPPQEPGPRLSRAPQPVLMQMVPIKVEQQVVGQIVLARAATRSRGEPTADRLVSAVASQIGIAVERARLRREATEAEVLRRTDELKTALLHAVSHDLRSPLASIMASSGSLRRKDVEWTEEDRDEFAAAIEEESARLNRIVGNLLDLSRLEAGTLKPDMDWYDLSALVDDVVGRLRSVTVGHAVSVHVPDDLPPVYVDYVEIDQVLSNLIENAAKYAPGEGEIGIRAYQAGAEIVVEVVDAGPGIPQPALSRLFEPFYRVQRQGDGPKGTGLGLAVARGLVEAHGGRIWAENRPSGGARFVFSLPLPGSEPSEVKRP